jgi:hypothetical protein
MKTVSWGKTSEVGYAFCAKRLVQRPFPLAGLLPARETMAGLVVYPAGLGAESA